VDEVYGMHNIPQIEAGEIRITEGPVMAAISGVKIIINGKGGHSSMPHAISDVISAGATILNNLHMIKSRLVNNIEHFVLTIT
jgi:metal-dependent amidase/aminoacylase/carboxypeptidase family protein